VIDADAIGHDVLEPGGAAHDAVVEAFGDCVLSHGRIDRAKLAALVFHDEDARRRLNRITHPPIVSAVAERCARLAAQGYPCVIVEAALLAEKGRKEPFLNGLIVIACPEETRLRRLVTTRGFAEDDARRRITAQGPQETKLALADYVIDNTGTVEDLRRRVDVLAEELMLHGE
jgi:dephospho-CoA kinase